MEDIQLFGPYQIISKQEAIDQGLSYYFTGMPCKRSYVAVRTVKFGLE